MEIDKRFVLRKDVEEMEGRDKLFDNYKYLRKFKKNVPGQDYSPLDYSGLS